MRFATPYGPHISVERDAFRSTLSACYYPVSDGQCSVILHVAFATFKVVVPFFERLSNGSVAVDYDPPLLIPDTGTSQRWLHGDEASTVVS